MKIRSGMYRYINKIDCGGLILDSAFRVAKSTKAFSFWAVEILDDGCCARYKDSSHSFMLKHWATSILLRSNRDNDIHS